MPLLPAPIPIDLCLTNQVILFKDGQAPGRPYSRRHLNDYNQLCKIARCLLKLDSAGNLKMYDRLSKNDIDEEVWNIGGYFTPEEKDFCIDVYYFPEDDAAYNNSEIQHALNLEIEVRDVHITSQHKPAISSRSPAIQQGCAPTPKPCQLREPNQTPPSTQQNNSTTKRVVQERVTPTSISGSTMADQTRPANGTVQQVDPPPSQFGPAPVALMTESPESTQPQSQKEKEGGEIEDADEIPSRIVQDQLDRLAQYQPSGSLFLRSNLANPLAASMDSASQREDTLTSEHLDAQSEEAIQVDSDSDPDFVGTYSTTSPATSLTRPPEPAQRRPSHRGRRNSGQLAAYIVGHTSHPLLPYDPRFHRVEFCISPHSSWFKPTRSDSNGDRMDKPPLANKKMKPAEITFVAPFEQCNGVKGDRHLLGLCLYETLHELGNTPALIEGRNTTRVDKKHVRKWAMSAFPPAMRGTRGMPAAPPCDRCVESRRWCRIFKPKAHSRIKSCDHCLEDGKVCSFNVVRE